MKVYGVNLAGGEFGTALPGILGQDYIYPQDAQFAYYASKGIKYVRLPFKPERIQRWAGGSLDAYALHVGLYPALDLAQHHGIKVLLDPHSFGRWYGSPYRLTYEDRKMLRSFVGPFVEATCDHPAVWGYELIGNEPHDMPGDPVTTWRLDYEAAEEARFYTNKMLVWAPTGWQSARFLKDNAMGFVWSGDRNSCIGVHVYGDGDSSGSYNVPYAEDVDRGVWPQGPTVTANTMAQRLSYAVDWAEANGVNLLVTECGTPQEPEWLAMLDNLLGLVSQTPTVLGAFLWAGGPWWGDYRLSTEPNADGSMKRQLTTLLKYT